MATIKEYFIQLLVVVWWKQARRKTKGEGRGYNHLQVGATAESAGVDNVYTLFSMTDWS